MNPNMPSPGEQIHCLSISSGKLTIHNEGTVRERDRFKLTEDEFTTTAGSRYDCRRLHPMTDPLVGYLNRFPTTKVFLYCRERDKDAALEFLRAAYVMECSKASTALRIEADQLQEFSRQALKQ